MSRSGHRRAPTIDGQVDSIDFRVRGQKNVNDVFECKREGQRQGKLPDTHQRRPNHQPHMGSDEAHETGYGRRIAGGFRL
jgi:hypothetical protein